MFTIQFMIVGSQRTGSSGLAEAIGSHPDVACGWEWTQRLPPWNKLSAARKALDGDFSLLPQKHRLHMDSLHNRSAIGFRRLFRASHVWMFHPKFSPALWIDRLEGHLAWIATRPDIHIIHIVRNNEIAWLTSKYLASGTGMYKGAQYPDGFTTAIPIRYAVRHVLAKRWLDFRLASLRASNPYTRSTYEDFLADNRTQAIAALTFLGCDPTRLPALQLRAIVQSNSGKTQISNLHEIRDAVSSIGPALS